MRTRLQTRLTFEFLAVLVLGMVLAAVLSGIAVERLYVDAQRDNLLAQARLTAAALQGETLPAGPPVPYSQAANVAPGIHTRLLDQSGAVVVGLPNSEPAGPVQVPAAEGGGGGITAEDLMQRPEIERAAQGIPSTAVRRVASAGNRRVIYAAAPIQDVDGQVTGLVYVAMPLPEGSLPDGVWAAFGAALLAATGMAGAAGTMLARRFSRPLVRLAQASQAVGAGDFSSPIAAGSDIVEIQQLNDAFGTMTASLQHSEQAKNAFLADVTHELRTPLTVIKGTIETLQDGALDDVAGRARLLASMQTEADRLIRLVNELLVLTRADAGALGLRLNQVDMVDLVRGRCDHFAPLAARRAVSLRVMRGEAELDDACLAHADADRMAQVLDNLLDNALRHAPEHSTVTVEVRRGDGVIRITVRDQGAGIPAEHLPFVFERFYRVDAARDRASGGSGLGLAIARALVEAQGGVIEARSGAGEGTSILLSLPAADSAAELPAS